MKADVLSENGIDYTAGLQRFMNDPALYEMVLASFARANTAERARAAYDANDRKALLNVVHEAKGTSGNAGLGDLYVKASALVKLLRSPDYTDDALAECFLQFERLCLSTQTAIQSSLE